MFVHFLDQIDHEKIEKENMIQLFNQVKEEDLKYSNSGYFSINIPNSGQIILLFWFVDLTQLVIRYDKNIPTVQEGESWLSCNHEINAELFDVGDDTWLPLNGIIPRQLAIDAFTMFYDQPQQLPCAIAWQNVDDVLWKD